MCQIYELDIADNKHIPTIAITTEKRCDYCRKILASDSNVYGYFDAVKQIGHHLLCFSAASKFIKLNEELVKFNLTR